MKIIWEKSGPRPSEIDALVSELAGKVIEVDTGRVRWKV